MKIFSLLRVEAGRTLRSRQTWVAVALTAISPAAGLRLYQPLNDYSANGTFLGNPALAGALCGAIIFAALTASCFNYKRRYGVEAITDTIHSPVSLAAAQTVSLLLAAAIAQAFAMAAWLPYTAMRIGDIFSVRLYLAVYLGVMFPAVCFAVLFAASAYMVSQRFDLSLALFAAFVMLNFTAWWENWLLRWASPALYYISDVFGNNRRLMSVCYNRLFWALALAGLWSLSLLCVRVYEKDLFGSACRNARRAYIPAVSAALLFCCAFVFTAQPFLDNSKALINYWGGYIETSDNSVTCGGVHVDARLNLSSGSYSATADYNLRNPGGEARTVSFYINPGYTISSATVNGQPASFRDLADDDMNKKTVEVDLPPGVETELVLEFGGFPREWNVLKLNQGDLEISRDYIYLSSQDFLPYSDDIVFDRENAAMTADIDLPEGMIPVLFGDGAAERLGSDTAGAAAAAPGSVRWRLTDNSDRIILYAGDYVSRRIDAAGIDVEFIYSQKHGRAMAGYDIDSIIRNVFEYCTAHIGPLSFMNGDAMKLIEIGAAGGGYAASGASVMGESSFSRQTLADPLRGAGGDEVLAHEIIHQWWGLGNMFETDGDGDEWSPEGLTVYTTYRLMKALYGDEYAKANYVDVWRRELESYYNNFYVRRPEYVGVLPKMYRADILNSYAHIRRYCEMPLKLLRAEELSGGEEAFDKILNEIFTRDYNEDYSNVYLSYELFLEYCGLTEEDLRVG